MKPIRLERFGDHDGFICPPAPIGLCGPSKDVPNWDRESHWQKEFIKMLRGEHHFSNIYHEEWWAWRAGKKIVCYDDYQWDAFERVVVLCYNSERLRKRAENRGDVYVPPWFK